MCPLSIEASRRLTDVDGGVRGCVWRVTGVVLNFQTLQIQQLVVVNDPGTRIKIRRQNFRGKTSFHKRVQTKKTSLN